MTLIITIGIAIIILPIRPPTNIKGKKAAIVVKDEAMTGANIRLAPPSDASKGSSP